MHFNACLGYDLTYFLILPNNFLTTSLFATQKTTDFNKMCLFQTSKDFYN